MAILDLMDEALELAGQQGFEIRKQWLGETAGGPCRIGSNRVLFINLSQPITEQLAAAVVALKQISQSAGALPASPQLTKLLN